MCVSAGAGLVRGHRKIALTEHIISVAAPHAACQGSLLSRCAAGAATKSSRAARLKGSLLMHVVPATRGGVAPLCVRVMCTCAPYWKTPSGAGKSVASSALVC